MIDLKQCRKQLDAAIARRGLLLEQAERTESDLASCEDGIKDALAAQKLVQEVAEAVQQSAHRQIASVVTRCLRAVFGPDAYEFKVAFHQKRGKTEAELLFCRDGLEADPTTAAGGGVVDVSSFALRLACLMLSRPARRRLLCLDEPFKHLSADHRPAVRRLVTTLAEEMKVQFLMISHSDEFRMGKVIRF